MLQTIRVQVSHIDSNHCRRKPIYFQQCDYAKPSRKNLASTLKKTAAAWTQHFILEIVWSCRKKCRSMIAWLYIYRISLLYGKDHLWATRSGTFRFSYPVGLALHRPSPTVEEVPLQLSWQATHATKCGWLNKSWQILLMEISSQTWQKEPRIQTYRLNMYKQY